MNIFPWTPDYSVGVFRLDIQHQEFIVLVNKLFESLLQGICTQNMDGYISELRIRSDAHFQVEEHAMADTIFPDTNAHTNAHKEFLAAMADYEIRARRAEGTLELYDLTRELTQYLKAWINIHLREKDKMLGRHLNLIGIH